MKCMLLMLGVVMFSLSATKGVAYADSGFMASLKGMLYNVAQRSDLSGAVNYIWNDAPSTASVGLPPHPNEWVAGLTSTIDLTPKTAILGSVEMGADNRLVQSRLGITHRIWGK